MDALNIRETVTVEVTMAIAGETATTLAHRGHPASCSIRAAWVLAVLATGCGDVNTYVEPPPPEAE
jgi:hypothetical protein